jgi:uncharacterized protein YbjT (DUF2867 family)
MIAILGATGKVGSKIAALLKKQRIRTRLVARSVDRLRTMVDRQTDAMAGDAGDTHFLVKAFQGADAVFTLIPPDLRTDNFREYANRIGGSIAEALEISRIAYVVNLSSIGAELAGRTGPITGLHDQEERLNRISGLNVLHVRAAYFMENLLMNRDLILSKGINGGTIRGDIRLPMIATADIASFCADRLVRRDFSGSSAVSLLGSRDLSMIEATMSIGIKIGKPNLPYIMFSEKDAEEGLVAAGLSREMSKQYIEMSAAFNEGRIKAFRTPENTTQTSFDEFCNRVLVPFYLQKQAA